MDERTLNDLLECSVCLERLDTSSKVLPCQHTFCRKCLEVIVASRQELRCPECRVLVDIKIDDLPPNVLLMRILEGMKNAAANQHNLNKSPKIINTSMLHPDGGQVMNSVVGGGSGGSMTIMNSTDHRVPPNATQKEKFIKCSVTEQMIQSAPNQQQQHQHKNITINDLHHQQQLHQSYPPNPQQQQQQHQPPQNPQSQQQNPSNVNNERGYVPRVFALYDFQSKEPNDLSFKKGDVILLRRKVDANWFVGELNGREGTFPLNYVQVIVPLPVPQCIALYDFKMGPNEEEGCLTFKRGTMIHVLRRVDHNWAEGRIGSCIGIFPIAFVEMNALAEQLLDGNLPVQATTNNHQQHLPPSATPRNLPPIPFDSNANDSTSSSSTVTTSPNSTCSSNSSSNSIPSSPGSNPTSPQNNPAVKYRDYKEKRHSLNALTSGANLSIIQSNRHSAEILSVPVSSTSGQECSSSQMISGGPSTQSASTSSRGLSVGSTMRDLTTAPTQSRVNVLKTGGQQNVPPSLPWGYLALYPYKPRKTDELELKKGCVYIVTERCLDGWFKGKNWQDMSGVFPGNYVTPLRSRDQQQLMHQWKFVQNSQPSSPQIHNSNTNQAPNNVPPPNPINILENINIRLSQMSSVPHQPPELPPRSAAGASSSSAWTKPLGHHMESLFGRKSTNGPPPQQCQQQQHAAQTGKRQTNKDSKDKHSGQDKDKQKDHQPHNPSSSSSSSSAVSLMKRLTNIKRSKSPSSSTHATNNHQSYSMDNPSFEDSVTPNSQALGQQSSIQLPPPPSNDRLTNPSGTLHPVHVRSGSCPSQLLQSLPVDLNNSSNNSYIPSDTNQSSFGSQRLKGNKERPQLQGLRQHVDGTFRLAAPGGGTSLLISTASNNPSNNLLLNKCQQSVSTSNAQLPVVIHHRKSQSLDANTISTQLTNNSSGGGVGGGGGGGGGSNGAGAAKGSSHVRESRFRCIVSYPPNSELELELNVGDIVYVHRKQKNGWYKGTHSRTNKSGLFPASFVEPDI